MPTKQGELEGLEDASTNLLRKCTVDANLSILNLVVVKKEKWEKDILGLTDTTMLH